MKVNVSEMVQKMKNTFSKWVLDLNLASTFSSVIFILSTKVKITGPKYTYIDYYQYRSILICRNIIPIVLAKTRELIGSSSILLWVYTSMSSEF
jgi:hypothetical protein